MMRVWERDNGMGARGIMRVWERGWSIGKLTPNSIYLVSLQNSLFDLVSLCIFVIFMFLEERNIKYKKKTYLPIFLIGWVTETKQS